MLKCLIPWLGLIMLAPVVMDSTAFAEARKRPPPDVELSFQSKTLTDQQFLRGDLAAGLDVTLTGELRLPNWDTRLPVVILVHGSDGPTSGAVAAWRQSLDKHGFATFRIDSFTGRDIKEVETNQRQLGLLNVIFDVYRAVDVLSIDERIDASRIVVMGFSRGGLAAIYASLRRFHQLYGPDRGSIAAYLPVYAGCGLGLVGDTEVVDAPIRAFHGEADDWVPMKACQDLTERMRAAGADATLTVFPGAHHAFDNPRATPVRRLDDLETPRNCLRKEMDGSIVNVETGKPFSYDDACIERGVTVGYDKAASDAASRQVMQILDQLGR